MIDFGIALAHHRNRVFRNGIIIGFILGAVIGWVLRIGVESWG